MIFALLGIFAGTGNAASTISAVAASSASSDSLSSLCQGVDHNSISEFTSATISKFCEDFPHTLSATSYVPCVASESEGFYPRDVLAAEDVEKEWKGMMKKCLEADVDDEEGRRLFELINNIGPPEVDGRFTARLRILGGSSFGGGGGDNHWFRAPSTVSDSDDNLIELCRLLDYGYCSGAQFCSFFNIADAPDKAAYCVNNDLIEDKWTAGKRQISACCVLHDKCLTNTTGYICEPADCIGHTCDALFEGCLERIKCNSGLLGGFDVRCSIISYLYIVSFRTFHPNGHHNPEGSDEQAECDFYGECEAVHQACTSGAETRRDFVENAWWCTWRFGLYSHSCNAVREKYQHDVDRCQLHYETCCREREGFLAPDPLHDHGKSKGKGKGPAPEPPAPEPHYDKGRGKGKGGKGKHKGKH